MTRNRLRQLRYFLFGERNNVTPGEFLRFFFESSYTSKVNRVIARQEDDGEYKKIYFKNYSRPLYYPSDFSFDTLKQVIGEAFYPTNWHYYEIPETRVSANDSVADCGAAEGLFAFSIQSRCKKVYLIEPLGGFCTALSRTFQGCDNVEILRVAISDQKSVAKINENSISSSLNFTGEGSGEDVKVTTLDELFYDKGLPIDYIKIDLEGYDVKALQGAKELIRKNKPKIAVTTYHHPKHAEQITEYLLSVVPEYNIKVKGIFQESGSPIMLHAWI